MFFVALLAYTQSRSQLDYQLKRIPEWHVFNFFFMLIYFSVVNFMFFATHLAPNIMLGPTIASGVILNPNILFENIALDKMNGVSGHLCAHCY